MIPEADARQAIFPAGHGTSTAGIARLLGHDRKTIAAYLPGRREPGQPRARTDAFAPFAAYAWQRAADDRHLRRSGLHREVTALGYTGSYSAFTRETRGQDTFTGCWTCSPRPSREPPPRRYPPQLPARVAPVAGETISSYLARLAAAAHVPVGNITGCLPPWFATRAFACDDLNGNSLPRPGDAAYLAALAGISENALRHALPALSLAHGDPRPPVRAARSCQRCTARHGQREPVPVHYPAHQRTCPRHQAWLGRRIQIDIAAVPEITTASRQASRLARTHGIARLVLAEATARQERPGGPDARRRAAELARASPDLSPWHPDTAEAAAYPETIKAAAALLRTPGALPTGPDQLSQPATSNQRANLPVTTAPAPLPIKKAHPGQEGGPGLDICHRTAAAA